MFVRFATKPLHKCPIWMNTYEANMTLTTKKYVRFVDCPSLPKWQCSNIWKFTKTKKTTMRNYHLFCRLTTPPILPPSKNPKENCWPVPKKTAGNFWKLILPSSSMSPLNMCKTNKKESVFSAPPVRNPLRKSLIWQCMSEFTVVPSRICVQCAENNFPSNPIWRNIWECTRKITLSTLMDFC